MSHRDCKGFIAGTAIACGEDGCYCSDACVLFRLNELEQENVRLRGEVLEARHEAAAIRCAYLHEKARAEAAGSGPEHAYVGPAIDNWKGSR